MDKLGSRRRLFLPFLCAFALSCAGTQDTQRVSVQVNSFNLSTVTRGGRTDIRYSFSVSGSPVNECTIRHLVRNGLSCGRVIPQVFSCSYRGPIVFQHYGCHSETEAVTFQAFLSSDTPQENDTSEIRKDNNLVQIFSITVKVSDSLPSHNRNISLAKTGNYTAYRLSFPRELLGRCHYEILTADRWLRLPLAGSLRGPVNQPLPCGYILQTKLQYTPGNETSSEPHSDYLLLGVRGREAPNDGESYEVFSLFPGSHPGVQALPTQELNVRQGFRTPVSAKLFGDVLNTSQTLKFTFECHEAGTFASIETLPTNSSSTVISSLEITHGLLSFVLNDTGNLLPSETNYSFTVTDLVGTVLAQGVITVHVFERSWNWDHPSQRTNKGLIVMEGGNANLTSKRLDFYILRECEPLAYLRLTVPPRRGTFLLQNGSSIEQSAVSISAIRNGSAILVYSHDGSSAVSDGSVWEVSCGSEPVFQLWLGVTVIPIDNSSPSLRQIALNAVIVHPNYVTLFHRSLLQLTDDDSGVEELTFMATPLRGSLVSIDPQLLYNTSNLLYPFVKASEPIWGRNATAVSEFSFADVESEKIWYIPPIDLSAGDAVMVTAADSSTPPNVSPPLSLPSQLVPHPPEESMFLSTNEPFPEVLQLRTLPLHTRGGVFITPYYLYSSSSGLEPASVVYVVESEATFGFICLPSLAACNRSVSQFTQRDINLQRVFYLPHVGQLKSDSFSFSVTLNGVRQAGLNQSRQFVMAPIKEESIASAKTFWVSVGDDKRVAAKFFRPYSQRLSRDVVFNINSGPFHGTLTVDRVASSNTRIFTFDDLLSDRVWYHHNGVAGICSDIISFTAVNRTHNISGSLVVAIKQNSGRNELTISIHPHTLFGQTNFIFSSDDLSVDGPFCSEFVKFTVVRAPLQGALTFTDTTHNTIIALSANATFTARNVAMGMLHYSLLIDKPLTTNISDVFELRAEDPISKWPSPFSDRINGEPEDGHFRVNIVPSPNVNYTLEILISSPRPLTWLPDRSMYGYIFTSADINIFNTTLPPSAVIIQVDQSPAFGRIMTNSTPVSLFSVEEVQAGLVWYKLNEHMVFEGLFRDTIDLRVFAELDDFVRLGAQHHFAVEWCTLRVEAASAESQERDGFARILVRRTGAIWFESSVMLTTQPRSATPSLHPLTHLPLPDHLEAPGNCSSMSDHSGSPAPDYCSLSIELTLGRGQVMREVLVPLLDDAEAEGPETFVVELSSPVDSVLSSRNSSTQVTITDTEDYAVVSLLGRPARTVPCELEVRIEENIGSLVLNLSRHGNLNEEVGVVCYTEEHTATSGRDFLPRNRDDPSSLVTFAPNQTRAHCVVEVINDPLNENSERFFVRLGDPQSRVLVNDSSTPICVYLNYDPADVPSVYFNSTELVVQEREDLTVAVNFTITRNGSDLNSTTKVFYEAYSKPSDSATAGRDFVPFSGAGCNEGVGVGCAEFSPGQTTIELPIFIPPDEIIEGSETFHVVIRRVHYGQTRFPEELRVTILDGTQPAIVQFSRSEYTFAESVSVAQVELTRQGYTRNTTRVKCVIKAGSAIPPGDFQPGDSPQEVTFPAGRTHATCYVLIQDDSTFEGPESFSVSLASIGDDISVVLPSNSSTATVIINDEEDIPVVQFSSANASVLEPFSPFPVDATNVTLPLIRSGDLAFSSSVSFTTLGGTAFPGTHYTQISGVVRFQSQETVKFISIPILSNNLPSNSHSSAFTVHLSASDAIGNGDGVRVGGRDSVRVVIVDQPVPVLPYFPALPEVVSLISEEEFVRGSHLFSDLPLACLNPCDTRHSSDYQLECQRQQINPALTTYSWELSEDGVEFHQVTLDTIFTRSRSAVLEPLYLRPSLFIRCTTRAVGDSPAPHTSGHTRTSRTVSLTRLYHRACEGGARSEVQVQMESYPSFAGELEDLVKVSILLRGSLNYIPIISSSHLPPPTSLAHPPPSPSHSSCSSLPPPTPDAITLLQPSSSSSHFPPSAAELREDSSVAVYSHFHSASCEWRFSVWLSVGEVVESCAGELSFADQISGNVTVTFSSVFVSVDSIGGSIVNGSVATTTGVLTFAPTLTTLTPPHYHTLPIGEEYRDVGYIYTIALSRIPEKLQIYFYSSTLFEGRFYANSTTTGEELTLLQTRQLADGGAKQAWLLEIEHPETGTLYLTSFQLYPCRLVSGAVQDCGSPIAFPMLLARDRPTEDFAPAFEVQSFLLQEADFDVVTSLSLPSAHQSNFTRGDVIQVVLRMGKQYRLVEGNYLVLETAQLCTSVECSSGQTHIIVENGLAAPEFATGIVTAEQLATPTAFAFHFSTSSLAQDGTVIHYYLNVVYGLSSNASTSQLASIQQTTIPFPLHPSPTEPTDTLANTTSAPSDQVYLFAAIAILLTAILLVAIGCTVVGLMVWLTRVKLGLKRKVESMVEEQRTAEARRKSLSKPKPSSKELEGGREGAVKRSQSTTGFPTAEKHIVKPKKKTCSTSSSVLSALALASQQKPARSRSLPNLSLATTKGFFPEPQRRHLGVPMTRVKVLNSQRSRLNSLGAAQHIPRQLKEVPIHRVVNEIAPKRKHYGVNEGNTTIKPGPRSELISYAVRTLAASAKTPEPGSIPNTQL